MADYSQDLLSQIKPDDKIVIYTPLDLTEYKKGCMGSSIKTYPGGFIAVTERRLVVKANQLDNGDNITTSVVQTINVPIGNVSSVTVREKKTETGGCCGSKTSSYFTLVINVQGGFYVIYAGKTPQIAEEFVRSFIDLQD